MMDQNDLSGTAEAVMDDVVTDDTLEATQDIADILEQSAFAGKIVPVLSKFLVSPHKAREIWGKVALVANWGDLLFLVLVGWVTVPAVRFPYDRLGAPILDRSPVRGVDGGTAGSEKKRKNFSETNLFHAAQSISQMAKVALLAYAVDVLFIVIKGMGYEFEKLESVPKAFAKIAFTGWAASRVAVFKRHLIGRVMSRKVDHLGRAQIIDRLLNALVASVFGFLVLDILSVEGFAVKSIFAFGSAGTLALGLASKDLAAQIMNGLALAASDKVYEGEEVRLGDGTAGTIQKLGWLETTLRTGNELVTSMPNSAFDKQKLMNLSRIKRCQVKQILRFNYNDVDKLPAILEDIKAEIKASCPALISDGTRPFRAYWVDFRDDYLEVMVDCRFNLRPTGDAYLKNKQTVLEAINRAVKKNGVSFYTSRIDWTSIR